MNYRPPHMLPVFLFALSPVSKFLVTMHMNSKRAKLSSNEFEYSFNEDSSNDDVSISDNSSNYDFLDINEFPNEIIVEIFKHLTQNELGRIAPVCRKWNELTKCPVLWQKVNVKFRWSRKSQDETFEQFINSVPCRSISVKLKLMEKAYYFNPFISCEPLDFKYMCVMLQENCPGLKELKMIDFSIKNFNLEWCTHCLPDLTNLVLYNVKFHGYTLYWSPVASKIEFLDISGNCILVFLKDTFSKMKNLKQLYLSNTKVDHNLFRDASFLNQLKVLHLGKTNVDSTTFQAIRPHMQNLQKLYLCSARLIDADFEINISEFPQLERICLNNCKHITRKGVALLVQACPSLQIVSVDECVAESYNRYQRLVEDWQRGNVNLHKFKIVKSIRCHEHNKCY